MREPSREQDGWVLEDGEESHRAYPDTFHIPALRVREGLQRGDYVKLMFRISALDDDEDAIERMWAIVSQRTGCGYLGVLNNKPSLIEENDQLWLGTELPFSAKHVIAAIPADEHSHRFLETVSAIPWRDDDAEPLLR